MDNRYTALATPPDDALKRIEGGNLKGKSDINAQWKIEAMTEQFGLCGIGWKYDIIDKNVVPLDDGQILLFMEVALRVRDATTKQWSEPVTGYGGDFIVVKNKNGLVPNDEAYKMCLTDALGNAFKYIGVAADVYRGLFDDSKYSKRAANNNGNSQPKPNTPPQQNGGQPKQANHGQLACSNCGLEIDQTVADFSVKTHGVPLCRVCQAKKKAGMI